MNGELSVETPKFPPFFPIFISGLFLGALGWVGRCMFYFPLTQSWVSAGCFSSSLPWG